MRGRGSSVLSNTVAWGSLEDHPQTPHKHLSLAQTLPQHPDARDSATALALGAKANGVTTRRVGNTGGKRSHASRTSGCPGELSSTSSAQPFIYICRHPNCRQERRLDASPHRQRCLCLDFVGIAFRPEFRLRRLIDAETVAVLPLLLGNHRQWIEVWLRHQLPREVP